MHLDRIGHRIVGEIEVMGCGLEGCKWVGKMKNIKRHRLSECIGIDRNPKQSRLLIEMHNASEEKGTKYRQRSLPMI